MAASVGDILMQQSLHACVGRAAELRWLLRLLKADAQWNSALPTPPIQDHPSTHSALGAAAAGVLAHAFGRDDIRFSFHSPTALPDAPMRSFASFSAAAAENADSRVRAGLHFRFATEEGLALGARIARHAIATVLQRAD